jgi:hypothetical protein
MKNKITHETNILKELTLVEKKNKIDDSTNQIRLTIKGLFEKIKAMAIEKMEIEIHVEL